MMDALAALVDSVAAITTALVAGFAEAWPLMLLVLGIAAFLAGREVSSA